MAATSQEETMNSSQLTGHTSLFRPSEDEERQTSSTERTEPYPLTVQSKSSAPPGSPTGVEEVDTEEPDHPFEEEFDSVFNPFREISEGSADATPKRTNATATEDCAPPTEDSPLANNESDVVDEIIESSQPAAESSVEVVFHPAGSEDDPAEDSPLLEETLQDESANGNILLENVMTPKLRLYLDDYDTSFFQKLMYAIMCQPCILKLDIYRSDEADKRRRSRDDMALFFQMVQSLPMLKVLQLSSMDAEVDMEHFHHALDTHPNLETLRLHLTSGVPSTDLFTTMTSMPKLTEVSLDVPEGFDFSAILQSSSLQRLHILSNDKNTFENAHLLPLVHALELNKSLTQMDLEPDMSWDAFQLISYALRINQGLQVLRVSVPGNPHSVVVSQAMQEICTVLSRNSTLRTWQNLQYSSVQVSMDCRRDLLKAISANNTLEDFVFFDEDISFANSKSAELRRPDANTTASSNRVSGVSTLTNDDATQQSADSNLLRSVFSFTSRGNQPPQPFQYSGCSALDQFDFAPYVQESKKWVQRAKVQGKRLGKGVSSLLVQTKRTSLKFFQSDLVTKCFDEDNTISRTASNDSESTVKTANNSTSSGR